MLNARYEISVFANFVVAKIINISMNFNSHMKMMRVNFDSDYVKQIFEKNCTNKSLN